MTTWRPKAGPWWTAGRWIHLWVGFVIPIASHALWGYPGLGWGLVVMVMGGCAWEVTTPLWARWWKWNWPFGDVVDLIAFLAGGLVAAVVCVAR